MLWKILADVIALIHGLWVLTVIGGPLLSWRWPRFRVGHSLMMLITILIMIFGRICPLTVWEQQLRAAHDPTGSYSGGFIVHYVTNVIHVDISPWAIFIPLVLWFLGWSTVYFLFWSKKGKKRTKS